MFRNGVMEATDCVLLEAMVNSYRANIIAPAYLERHLITCGNQMQQAALALGLNSPTVFFIGLLNVHGYRLHSDSQFDGVPFDRQHIATPDLLVEDMSTPAAIFLRPAFDLIWQASGGDRCPYYDAGGKRVEPR